MTDVAHTSDQIEEDKVLPIVVYALYLLGFMNGLTFLVGLIVAYVNRETAGPINASHYTFAIRTFWLSIWWFLIGVAMILVGLPLSLLLIGIPIFAAGWTIVGAVSIFFAVRTVLGLVYLLKGEAYPRPRAWLI